MPTAITFTKQTIMNSSCDQCGALVPEFREDLHVSWHLSEWRKATQERDQALHAVQRLLQQPGAERVKTALVTVALILLGSVAQAEEQPRRVQFNWLGAASVVMSGEAKTSAKPFVSVRVRGPLAFGTRTHASVYSDLTLLGLPSELEGGIIDGAALETLNSVALTVGLERQIGRIVLGDSDAPECSSSNPPEFCQDGQIITTAVYTEGGFSTRLAHDPAPLDRYPRHNGIGIRIGEEVSEAELRVGLGLDQRLDGTWQPAVTIRGQVPVWTHEGTGVNAVLGGNAILSINDLGERYPGAKRDVVAIFVGVSR